MSSARGLARRCSTRTLLVKIHQLYQCEDLLKDYWDTFFRRVRTDDTEYLQHIRSSRRQTSAQQRSSDKTSASFGSTPARLFDDDAGATVSSVSKTTGGTQVYTLYLGEVMSTIHIKQALKWIGKEYCLILFSLSLLYYIPTSWWPLNIWFKYPCIKLSLSE